MTTGTQAPVAAAKDAVDQAEADLLSGTRSVSADVLHKLRDGWRHADLTAQRSRQAAEEERSSARLKGLEGIGEQVDKLAQPEYADQFTEALRDVAAACGRFWSLVSAHDAGVAELVATATDLDVEPLAPGGPRGTSSYVAVNLAAITHKTITVNPVGPRAYVALQHAMSGDVGRAAAELQVSARARQVKRPDHVLRGRSGGLFPMDGPLNDGFRARLRTGELVELSDYDVDRYMMGELA